MVRETAHPNPLALGEPMSNLCNRVHFQLDANSLVEQTLARGQGQLNDTGALCIETGEFTGRSPKDRFIVSDEATVDLVDWGDVNIPISTAVFDKLLAKMKDFVKERELWISHCYAGADERFRINVTAINTTPWANLFCQHLFICPSNEELLHYMQEWVIFQVPEFQADPSIDGTRQKNFSIINFTKKMILIGGTAYTGEMKKGIFSVLNFLLPQQQVLPMHCSANEGAAEDVALFFGLSGTGKTTLSADPNRKLIGDDEHGWSDDSIFNFEGGCYAKCIDLSAVKEPEIFAAIKQPALLENVLFYPDSNTVDYGNASLTENTRAAYPIVHIANAKIPSTGRTPSHIFFLTCDAYGVLPPIAKLTKAQAMYHFLSGYTAKVAGTEIGVTEPQTTFSACFGRVFLPSHPTAYAKLLGEKLEQHPEVQVWLVNTGWTGGAYGVGQRIQLKHTRNMVQAALNGDLANQTYKEHTVFGVWMPENCAHVPSTILDPRETWEDKLAYDEQANRLATLFRENFEQYQQEASAEIIAASPVLC